MSKSPTSHQFELPVNGNWIENLKRPLVFQIQQFSIISGTYASQGLCIQSAAIETAKHTHSICHRIPSCLEMAIHCKNNGFLSPESLFAEEFCQSIRQKR